MDMPRARPTSIRLFLVNGSPEGIRIVEKSNWTGIAVVASRAQLAEALNREELTRPGVYVLSGPGEGGAPRLYVGEADVLRERLKQHAGGKDFWTRFVAFSSSNAALNKAHVRYLEARLIALARAAKQWELENTASPAQPSLSEADRADAEWFLHEMLLIYPLLGIDAFELATDPSVEVDSARILRLSERGAQGQGREFPEGFVVFAGSRARLDEVPSIPAYLHELRQQLRERGVLVENDGGLEFRQDYRFSSPSNAAGVLIGGSVNGLIAWKSPTGETLRSLQGTPVEAG